MSSILLISAAPLFLVCTVVKRIHDLTLISHYIPALSFLFRIETMKMKKEKRVSIFFAALVGIRFSPFL